jgi:A-factor biosynthesis hotdog protein
MLTSDPHPHSSSKTVHPEPGDVTAEGAGARPLARPPGSPGRDTPQVLHVVGDKLVTFANENPGVMTVSNLEKLLEKKEVHRPHALIVGQGVSLERLSLLEERIQRSAARSLVTIQEARIRDRCPGKYTHKHFNHNTIITLPYKDEAADLYRCHLVLDDDCAEMSDHVTGHHLQGVVFFEASRQMLLAATELFWLEQLGRPYYFVLNEYNITYHTFGFPLPTDITMKVLAERGDTRQSGSVFLDIKVEFFQVGVPITECVIKYAAFDKALLSAREGLLSRMALVKHSPSLSPINEADV